LADRKKTPTTRAMLRIATSSSLRFRRIMDPSADAQIQGN
jgi:hypothetical protein